MRPIWQQTNVESASQEHSLGGTLELEIDIDQRIAET